MISVRQKGYTVLELMIVIAVSGAMFFVVAVTFGGRQQQVQFTQAVRDFDSRIKDIRNDVSLGYYPVNKSVACRVGGSPGSPRPTFVDLIVPGSEELGSNEDCISIGKVIQFSPEGNDFNADNNQIIKIYNVVGLRRDKNGSNPTTVLGAVPAATPSPEQSLLKWGLVVKKVVYTNNLGLPDKSSGIAVFSELSRGSQLQTSASNEAVQISAIPNVAPNISEADMIQNIGSIDSKIVNGTMNFNNSSRIVICVTDADDKRRATITFGRDASGSVIDFDNYDLAVCG